MAAFVGAISGFFGALISYTAPRMPTGPWIIVVLSVLAFISILFGLEKGVVFEWNKRVKFRQKVNAENLLKTFFHLSEIDNDIYAPRTMQQLMQRRSMGNSVAKRAVQKLLKVGYLVKTDAGWKVTVEGGKESMRLVRLHRLWEIYLSEYLNVAADHVHDDADAIEHILTPELQHKLEAILAGKTMDPHNKRLPDLDI